MPRAVLPELTDAAVAETIESGRDWRAHWAAIDLQAAKDDFLVQVGRTIAGKPVPADQVALVVEAVRRGLALGPEDVLLDLCCGNGLVTVALAAFCRAITGVDYTADLIEQARRHHQAENVAYVCRAADKLVPADFPQGRATKLCMNFALQYFTAATLSGLLHALETVMGGRAPCYFSDVPDAERVFAFYNTAERRAEFERRRAAGTEAMGTWWSREELRRILDAGGYRALFIEQDPRRLTAHYRFDLLAHPRS